MEMQPAMIVFQHDQNKQRPHGNRRYGNDRVDTIWPTWLCKKFLARRYCARDVTRSYLESLTFSCNSSELGAESTIVFATEFLGTTGRESDVKIL